jgi:hypothetical protein
MTEERKTEKPRVENLELNKETVQDLTESDTDAIQGGLRNQIVNAFSGHETCETASCRCVAS